MSNPETTQVMSLPLPPANYVNLYSDEHIRKNRAPKPPMPILDTYSMFGIQQFNNDDNIIRPLETQGFRRLYPQHFDRKKELKKLNHSLLVNFLDLIDFLVHNPDNPRRAEKIDDLSLLFVHIHHLLNEFRPHQARETLRVMMEMQKRQRIETAHRFQKHLDRVREIIKNAFSTVPDQTDEDNKLLTVPVELMDFTNENATSESNQDHCHPLDRLMCSIVDNM
ncbi:mediator of RNA polymerase II transcription subunit 7 [Lutzomyia longipalpis]|uniref:mediator of RNA polymerase II transcription subunit 7 n=1 Tax=Lutzomyia longipalpis TaxID=7200 RepID=UPI002483FF5B|nr:mediator of RNA polymerase II transcription subunit 7 [Lutzomyia longipalpis]